MIFAEKVQEKLKEKGKELSKRERDICKKYYGISGVRHTLKELGEQYNVTAERIRQIKFEALSKMGLSPRNK